MTLIDAIQEVLGLELSREETLDEIKELLYQYVGVAQEKLMEQVSQARTEAVALQARLNAYSEIIANQTREISELKARLGNHE